MNDKESLRIWAKEIRANLDIESLSKKLVKKLTLLEEYKNAKNSTLKQRLMV